MVAKRPSYYLLIVLALGYTAYLASSLLLPFFVALFFAMSLAPIARVLTDKLKFPRPLASILTMFIAISLIAFISLLVMDPLQAWVERFPQATENIAEQIDEISEPLDPTAGENSAEVSAEIISQASNTILSILATGTPILLAQIAATIILIYFYLSYGEDILRRLVTIRQGFSEKKVTVEIVRSIQDDLSYYLLVILIINSLLGLAVYGLFSVAGIEDAMLWGFLAGLLNFAPYLGPFVMCLILLGVGLIEYSSPLSIFMPVLLYMTLNMLEANFITPTVLGKRLKLNPLVVLVWLFAWGWIWGAAGFLLGVPMLVALKIISRQTGFLGDWVLLIEEPEEEPVKATLPTDSAK